MTSPLFKGVATLVVVVALGLSVTVSFAATPVEPSAAWAGESSARPVLGNSRENSAVLVAENIAPGDSVSRTVTISNRGPVAASLALSMAGLREKLGQGGGQLSAKLELGVEDVTGGRPPAPVYGGTVGSMSRQMLGMFGPGESRTYRFEVTFPSGGAPSSPTAGDNAYMGGSMSIDFHWTASQ
jgi:hypothetical protein